MNSLTQASISISETYELLVSLLAKCPQTIEILPGDSSIWMQTRNADHDGAESESNESELPFFPFLFVEENLGVPQKILYKIYLYAVGIFKSARNSMPARSAVSTHNVNDLDTGLLRTLVASSSVLILANPSHQTALNARKHLVQMHRIDPHDELRFVASLLSSQHCVKHAELWYHRRWLLSAAYASQSSDVAVEASPHCLRFISESQDVFQRELGLVSRACEPYPRNYFAWMHWQICMRSFLLDYLSGKDIIGFIPAFRREIARIKEWISCHVSDYSAMHSILTLYQFVFQCGDMALQSLVAEEDILSHAISLVKAYPAHEALWMYVQGVLSIFNSWGTKEAQQFISSFVQPLANSQESNTISEDDMDKVLRFSKLFLDKKQNSIMSLFSP